MAQKGRTLTGARARLSMNGKKVGYATGVNISEEIEYQPQEVLDNIEVDEHIPTAYRVSMSASLIRIVGETMKSQGYFPKTGKSPEEHLTNILLQEDMVATIEDSKTGKIPYTVEQVKIASKNVSISARGIVGKDVAMVCTRVKDESEVV